MLAACACRGNTSQHASKEGVDASFARLPRALRAALLPFQLEGVRYGLERSGRCLIADEMGVGKTLQAIALASCYQVGVTQSHEAGTLQDHSCWLNRMSSS